MKLKVTDIREHFKDELGAGRFTIDKTGQKTIEMIGASFIADEEAIFGTVNEEYVGQELEWYEEQSTNINDIRDDEPPKAWNYAANAHGEINSNYGYLIYHPRFYQQYDMALDELICNRDSRRAIMIYNRPSIWAEYNDNGKNDFICTNAVCYYIRDGYMHACVQMRSNDVVFGYKNDRAWAQHVLERLTADYNLFSLPDAEVGEKFVKPGDIHWQVQNLHVYEKHFHLVNPYWNKENE